jgi:hypothetical protein
VRVRDYPITLDKLIARLPAVEACLFKISRSVLPAAVGEMHGESVLECLALTDPGKLATIVAEKMSS